jgi:hypothetical protein
MRLVFFLSMALIAAAQSHPDFTGAWKLNLEVSDYSSPRAARPDKMTWTIQQKGDHFKYKVEVERAGRKGNFDVDVKAGGSPFESDAAGVVSIEWKGNAAVVSTLYNPGQDRQSDQVETWMLSADGKRLTDDLIIHPPNKQPDVHIVRVFDKQ